MALINDVKQMQDQGFPEEEIISTLKERGVSPLEIQQAIDQSKIKSAIDTPEAFDNSQVVNAPTPGDLPQYNDLTPSVMQPPLQQQSIEMPSLQGQDQYQDYSGMPQYQDYQQYPQQQQESSFSPDIINEIVEQVSSEKFEPLRKTIVDLADFSERTDKKMKLMDERMKKMEETYDALQLAILGKIGSYIKNTEEIKKEMEMMQESVGKVAVSFQEAVKKRHVAHRKMPHNKSSHPHKTPHGVG